MYTQKAEHKRQQTSGQTMTSKKKKKEREREREKFTAVMFCFITDLSCWNTKTVLKDSFEQRVVAETERVYVFMRVVVCTRVLVCRRVVQCVCVSHEVQ